MQSAKKWIFYKIYSKENVENWYGKLLSEIAKPFADKYRSETDCIWFNYYAYQLKVEEWKEMKCKEFFKAGDRVHFIRFRVRTEEKKADKLESELSKLIEKCDAVKTKEKCIEDTSKVLANEFGVNRVEMSVKFLNVCSEIVLSILSNNELDFGKCSTQGNVINYKEMPPYRFLHYFHNMLTLRELLELKRNGNIYMCTPMIEKSK